MAICKQCGNEYSIWMAQGLGTGLCNDCWVVKSAKDAEEKKQALLRQEEEANAALPILFATYAPGENAEVMGVAYWNTMGSAIGTGVAKIFFGGLLGGFGMALSGTEHRAGIIAVTENQLFLIDVGMIVGENLTIKELRGAIGPSSMKKVDF